MKRKWIKVLIAIGIITTITLTSYSLIKKSLYANEYCFVFDDKTGTIIDYHGDSKWCSTDITIPSEIRGVEVEAIGDHAFDALLPNHMKLTSVVIPDTVKVIGESAFAFNDLETIVLPNSVTTIKKDAFRHNRLKTLNFPEHLTTIEEGVFEHNEIRELIIPNTVNIIGSKAFAFNWVETVTIGSGVTEIKDRAFVWNDLSTIEIPSNVTTIGEYAFNKYSDDERAVEWMNVVIEGDSTRFNDQWENIGFPEELKPME